jgi:hypothetical protein
MISTGYHCEWIWLDILSNSVIVCMNGMGSMDLLDNVGGNVAIIPQYHEQGCINLLTVRSLGQLWTRNPFKMVYSTTAHMVLENIWGGAR